MKSLIKLITMLLISILFIESLSAQCNDFVRLDGKRFVCGGGNFFPVVLNYVPGIYYDANGIFPGRYHRAFSSQCPSNQNPPIDTRAKALANLLSDFQTIKAAGFNTVRLTAPVYGSTYIDWEHPNDPNNQSSYPAIANSDIYCNNYNLLNISSNLQPQFDCIQNLLDAATQANLKVILLVGGGGVIPTAGPTAISNGFITFLGELAKRFKYNPTLMTIDFFNEPQSAYGNLSKTQVCSITKSWQDAVKNNSDILTTIGINNSDAVIAWDPNIVNADFISFHPYFDLTDVSGYASDLKTPGGLIDRFKSELLWYKNNVSLPWIIGETGVMARATDTGGYPISLTGVIEPTKKRLVTTGDQAYFLQKTLEATRDYGGSGYSWWATSELDNSEDFYGIFKGGNTLTLKSSTVSTILNSFSSAAIPANAVQPPNYFNYYNKSNTYYATGNIYSSSGQPIVNALVHVFYVNNGNWTALGNTYTDAAGFYNVKATGIINVIMVSATDCSTETLWNANPQSANVITGKNLTLTKIARPTTSAISYSNQSITNASIYSFAADNIIFSNYTINSGYFNTKAARIITFSTGTTIATGTNFSARISAYYQDCGSLLRTNGTAFGEIAVDEPESDFENREKIIAVFPNPGNGHYYLDMNEEDRYQLEVYNSNGGKIKTVELSGKINELDLSEYSAGLYMLIVKDVNKKQYSFKLIKQ